MMKKFPWSKSINPFKDPEEINTLDNMELVETGKIVKMRREEYAMSRRDLAAKTRISSSVIEAIEEGWIEKLPEKAYLSSMIIILEKELNLKKGYLKKIIINDHKYQNKSLLRTFTPGGIDILSTWQGSLLYIVLMLLVLLVLNSNQRKLANMNTLEPIKLRVDSINLKDDSSSNKELNNKQLPTIKKKQTSWFQRFVDSIIVKRNIRLLILKLESPSKIKIIDREKQQTILSQVKGEVRLRLFKPISLEIIPPPTKSDSVILDGEKFLPERKGSGVYLLKENFTSSKADSNERSK